MEEIHLWLIFMMICMTWVTMFSLFIITNRVTPPAIEPDQVLAEDSSAEKRKTRL